MGRGRDAGSGVLAWRTRRLKIKADQTQYDRLRAPWGGAILLRLPLFFVFRKSLSSSTIRDKRGLVLSVKKKVRIARKGEILTFELASLLAKN